MKATEAAAAAAAVAVVAVAVAAVAAAVAGLLHFSWAHCASLQCVQSGLRWAPARVRCVACRERTSKAVRVVGVLYFAVLVAQTVARASVRASPNVSSACCAADSVMIVVGVVGEAVSANSANSAVALAVAFVALAVEMAEAVEHVVVAARAHTDTGVVSPNIHAHELAHARTHTHTHIDY